MMNTKRLMKMARSASFVRRSPTSSPTRGESTSDVDGGCSSSTPVLPSKGHIFVYTNDEKRFMIPLEFLNSNIFRELLRISEEEFGFRGDGPIRLSSDAQCMEYIISSLRSRVTRDVDRALLASITNNRRCMYAFPSRQQHTVVCGF